MALTEPEFIALITATATVAATSIPAWLSRRELRKMGAKVGNPNGQGSLVEMVTKLQANDEAHNARFSALERSVVSIVARLDMREPRSDGTGALNGRG